MQEGVSPMYINQHLELRLLKNAGWLKTNEAGDITLAPAAVTLIQQVEGYFRVKKKKTSSQLMGKDHDEMIQKYLLTFPKKVLPSGKPARADKRNIQTAFRWFFENHSYDWDIVLEAASRYVYKFEKQNYKYMQTSQYFIRKQQSDKTWISELANYCAVVQSGQAEEDDHHFSENVV